MSKVGRANYLCDPELHTECPKTFCHINNGPCRHTFNIKFAKQPVEKVYMLFPMTKEDLDIEGVREAYEESTKGSE